MLPGVGQEPVAGQEEPSVQPAVIPLTRKETEQEAPLDGTERTVLRV